MAAATPSMRGFAESVAARQGYPDIAIPQIVDQVKGINGGPLIAGAWRSFAFLLLAAAPLYALQQWRLAARAAVVGLPIIVGADRWALARLDSLFLPPAKGLFASDPPLE